MLEFIQNPMPFNIPQEYGKMDEDLFRIEHDKIPFVWTDKVSHEGNAMVDIYRVDPVEFGFRGTFVVKKVWNKDQDASLELFEQEWKITKDLRHPHITALVTAFEFQTLLYLGFYPAARCDLGRFMEYMMSDVGDPKVRGPLYHKMYPRCKNQSTEGSTSPEISLKKIKEYYSPQEVEAALWPLDLDLEGKQDLLRRFFGCLCKALDYLHKSCSIRHKDIKPGNILIDACGSVLITDFGISRYFPGNTSHATREHRSRTDRYASPEMLKDEDRDDRSDTFSLGCVFLEMATLLLGYKIDEPSEFREHFKHTVNEELVFKPYADQLPRVRSWMQKLRDKWNVPTHQQSLTDPNDEVTADRAGRPDWKQAVVLSLDQIELMLSEKKEARPDLDDLWKTFKTISPEKENCEDCMWQPPPQQLESAKISRDKRPAMEQGTTRNTNTVVRQQASLLGVITEDPSRNRSRSPPNSVKELRNAVPFRSSQENIARLSQTSLPGGVPLRPASSVTIACLSIPAATSQPSCMYALANPASTLPPVRNPVLDLSVKVPIVGEVVEDRPNSAHQDDGATAMKALVAKSSVQLPPPAAEKPEITQAKQSDTPHDDAYVLAYDIHSKRVSQPQYGTIAREWCHCIPTSPFR